MDNYIIKDDKDHLTAIQKISALTKKNGKKLTEKKTGKLKALTSAVEAYKGQMYTIAAPTTLEEVITLKMYERKLKQKDLARLLEVGAAKLSQLMSKKRKPDVVFLKALHEKLGIDGNVLLKYV